MNGKECGMKCSKFNSRSYLGSDLDRMMQIAKHFNKLQDTILMYCHAQQLKANVTLMYCHIEEPQHNVTLT
jgi:hypothetical protein